MSSERGPPSGRSFQTTGTTDEKKEVRDVIELTPTIIRRVRHEEHTLEVVRVSHQESGDEALLVFMNEEQAEAFRADTGSYPVSEGFEVGAVDVEGIKANLAVWGFPRVALKGPEPDVTSFFEAGEFTAMLESVEPIWTD